jgi:ubiquinone biosynthesis protein Coq4
MSKKSVKARNSSLNFTITQWQSYSQTDFGATMPDSPDLDANLLRESAFIAAHKARGADEGYLAERGFQLHDLFHVLTGYDTSPLGEVKVVSFTVAQAPAPYPAMIIASRPLQMMLYQPELLPFVMDAITEGWSRGRSASPLLPVHWEDHWYESLADLQQQYDLD